MDPIAHCLTGLLIGKTIGVQKRRSLVLAVTASWTPDFDIVSWGMSQPPLWLVHRSVVTHSFFCAAVLAIPFAILFSRWEDWSLKKSLLLALALLGFHVFSDLLTSYGTPIWGPFLTTNYSLDLISPINFVLSLAVAVGLVLAFKRNLKSGLTLAWLSLSLFFLGSWTLKRSAKKLLIEHVVDASNFQFSVYPHLLAPWKFRAVGENEKGYQLFSVDPIKSSLATGHQFLKPGDSIFITNSKKADRVRWLLKHTRWPIARIEKTARGYRVIWGDLLFVAGDGKSNFGGVAAELDERGNLPGINKPQDNAKFLSIKLLIDEILIHYHSFKVI